MTSERAPRSEEYSAEIIRFPNYDGLLSFSSEALGDIEIEELMNATLKRAAVLSREKDQRSRYVIETVLEALQVIAHPAELYTALEDKSIVVTSGREEDEAHTKAELDRIDAAEKWEQWHLAEVGRIEHGEKLYEDIEVVRNQWGNTTVYRAFKHLSSEVIGKRRRDAFDEAILEANRTAIVMMARATPGYTEVSET